jgi:hypothetical protein
MRQAKNANQLHVCVAASLALGLLASSSTARADQMMASKPITIRFGVEADFASSNRVDQIHSDLELLYNSAGTFGAGIDFNAGPLGSFATNHYYVNASRRFTPATIPAQFAFWGASNGQTVWTLSQASSLPNALWLGVAGENIPAAGTAEMVDWSPGQNNGTAAAKWLELSLVGVRGPAGANVSLYQILANNQPSVYWATSDGIASNDAFYVQSGAHLHAWWVFTQPGTYEIDVQLRTNTNLNWLAGDANRDGFVDRLDLNALAQNFGTRNDWFAGDFTGDGLVDLQDFFALGANWNPANGSLAAAWADARASVPEPATIASLGTMALVALRRRSGATTCTQVVERSTETVRPGPSTPTTT